ncbi:hypothetical protein [Paenibacillus terrigena]|nr:hypothetical protein [Paenibacillus terrigena]
MDNPIEQLKKGYQDIPIPKELECVVEQAIKRRKGKAPASK